MEKFRKLGKANFEAYCEEVGHQTHDQKPIPAWENLTEAVRQGWIAGALAVKNLLQGVP